MTSYLVIQSRKQVPNVAQIIIVVLLICAGLSSIVLADYRASFTIEGTPAGHAICDSAHQPVSRPVRAVFIGDSYTSGTGGAGVRWTSIVSRRLGWVEINLGRGGTGYQKTSTVRGCGSEYCPSYPEMVAAAVSAKPDLVVVSGGRSDAATTPDAVSRTFVLLRRSLPNTTILALEPFWDSTEPPTWLANQADAISRAVESQLGIYVPIGHPLVGYPGLIDRDGINPNANGYRKLAEAVEVAIHRKVGDPPPWKSQRTDSQCQ